MEACGFRDSYGAYEAHDTVILGVSRDAPESHEKFSSKYRLPFLLLSDPSAAVATAYGVYGKRSFLGREFFGIHRATFVIDATGTIRRVFPKIKVREHAEEVLQFVRTELA